MASRYFTLEEAQECVPWLEEVFQTLGEARNQARRLSEEVADLEQRMSSNGGSDLDHRLSQSRRSLKEQSDVIADAIQPVIERGISVKSIEQGLVDFPHLREGREVYLCWRQGEAAIHFWHDLDSGYAGRQAL